MSVLNSERKKRQEEILKKDDELEELRRKLAELEKENVDNEKNKD